MMTHEECALRFHEESKRYNDAVRQACALIGADLVRKELNRDQSRIEYLIVFRQTKANSLSERTAEFSVSVDLTWSLMQYEDDYRVWIDSGLNQIMDDIWAMWDWQQRVFNSRARTAWYRLKQRWADHG